MFTNASEMIVQMQQINNYCKHHQNPVIFAIDFMAINVNNHRDAFQINSCALLMVLRASPFTVSSTNTPKHPHIYERVTTSARTSNIAHRNHLSMQKWTNLLPAMCEKRHFTVCFCSKTSQLDRATPPPLQLPTRQSVRRFNDDGFIVAS